LYRGPALDVCNASLTPGEAGELISVLTLSQERRLY
jgi:hypothetical protein